ncbi:MAG: AAA family ATPase [Gammaproteobacteria bacterium]|nr:AAA family ATPase [Gammaproteobacteria bacterium]
MYESFYGLQTKPFSLLPDPGFLYMGKKHKVALALLEYALMNNAGFCVITGEIGAGKTTLLRKLLENIEDNITVGMITNTHQSFGELLDWVLSAFGIHEPGLSKVEMHQRLVDFLLEQYANNKSTLLIVDEAQNMSASTLEELRMLSNINSEKDLVLQIILSGQPGLRDTLRKPELLQFVQRISVDYHLDALTIDESCAYIQHRLVTAGAQTDVFTPEACRLIHAYSGGIPRLINLLADTALVYAFADQKQMVGADIIEEMVSERMENSILPLAKVDSNSNTITTDDSGFPWISPDGGSQGLKPVAEKKTAEKVVTSINKQNKTAKPAESAEPVEAPKKSKSVTRPEKLDAAEPAPGDDASLEAAEDTIEAAANHKDVPADDSRTKPAADADVNANLKRVADSPKQGEPSHDSPEDIPQLAEEQAIVVDQTGGTAPGRKPGKSNKTPVIAGLLVFVVAALIVVSAGSLYSGKELKSEVKNKMAEVEKIKRDMERMQSERDAALARAQEEEAQRAQQAQAAIEAAAREREAMAAAALAAEQALQAKKEAEELAKQQRLKEKRLREERERLQMEKKRAELEQQRIEQERRQAELEKQRLALEKAEREKLAQQEREKRIAREQAELFKSMEATAAAKAEELKKAKQKTTKKESSFSTDPCSSPSAKFLSTCR